MSHDRFQHIKSLFLKAADLEGEQRKRFLDQACGDDQDTRREVISLLGHHSHETILEDLDTPQYPAPPGKADPDIAWEGQRIGRYSVRRLVDSGGMGDVLEAYDEAIDRRVAIKVLHTMHAADDLMRQRFLAEARAAGNINHPNVITIYEAGVRDNEPYIVMEFVEGGSTADHLDDCGPYPPGEATNMIAQACRGLGAAHARGLVHRDIKPANLLVAQHQVVKVSDFGIAKATDEQAMQLTREGQIVGTPNYMSPEQCEGRETDLRCDLYSLGATYYSLLVGLPPYHDQKTVVGLINAHCNADPPDPRDQDPSVPAGCAAIVRRAMAKQARDRYQSAEEMRNDLARYESLAAPRKKKQAFKLPAMLAVPLALFLCALGYIWLAPIVALPAGEPLRIGILHSLSGTLAHNEAMIVDAYELAISELNQQGGVNGRLIEPVLVNGHSDDQAFAQGARKLIAEDRVCTIFGCLTSSSRKAVKDVVEEYDHLLVYSVNNEGLEISPNIIYLGGDPTQTIIPVVRWACTHGDNKKFFLVGSDYVFSRVANEIIKDQLVSLGGTVLGEEYLPLGDTHVSELVDAIKQAEPDAIINTISGDTQTAFRRVLRAKGVTATQFSTGIGEQELRQGNIAAEVGDYTVATYFQSIETPENEAFVERFKDRYGRHRSVSAPVATAYSAVMLWAKAVEQAGDSSPAAIRDAICKQETLSPGGTLRVDPKTQYAYRRSYMGRVTPEGLFQVVWQSEQAIPPHPFPASRPESEWKALLDQLHTQWGGRWSAPQPPSLRPS